MTVLFRRPNGTFIIAHPGSGLPYHVTADDPLWAEYRQEALTAPLEPEAPPAPTPPPGSISDRQFFQMLAVLGLIEQGEALAAVKTGDMPMPLQVLLENVPMQDRFAAEMLLSGATSFDRSHPLVPMLGFAFGWSASQLDDFWREAAKL